MRIDDICRLSPVIPVIVIDDLDDALPLAETLVSAGLRVLEFTLRTTVALAAIERVARSLPDAVIGAGTLKTGADIAAARSAGAHFGVSPGTPDELRAAILDAGWPFLPGCSTVTEAMTLEAAGFTTLKLFPAEAVGGKALIGALTSPFPRLAFCPTGGITSETAAGYLALPNVPCVGGSWMVSPTLIKDRYWSEIATRATAAARLSTATARA